MIKLLVIADDFTGAIDTGVQFASRGAETCVMADTSFDMNELRSPSVLVVNAETRHLEARKAYETVHSLVSQLMERGVEAVYKKTDSGLRGNIGAEIAAVMDAVGTRTLAFVPAFPKMNRVTRGGIQYIDGVPVAESMFGTDPFEPVRHSDVREILAEQTDKAAVSLKPSDVFQGEGVALYDAESETDLNTIADSLGKSGLRYTAGCAGFASVLAERLGLCGETPNCPDKINSLLMLCGSLNPVTARQMDYAEHAGYPRVRLSGEQKLNLSWMDSAEGNTELQRWMELTETKKLCIVDAGGESGNAEHCEKAKNFSGEELRNVVAEHLGGVMKRLLDMGFAAPILCTGGDTLLAVMRSLGITELIPMGEMSPGVVLSRFRYRGNEHQIISKSGGFGKTELLCELIR